MRAVLHWFRTVVTATGFCALLCWPATSAPSFAVDARAQSAVVLPQGSREPARVAAVRGPEAALGAFNGSRHPGSRESAGDSGRSERGGNGSMALLLAGLGVVALAAARAPRRQ